MAAVRASPAVGTADLRRAQPGDVLERVAALRAAGVANPSPATLAISTFLKAGEGVSQPVLWTKTVFQRSHCSVWDTFRPAFKETGLRDFFGAFMGSQGPHTQKSDTRTHGNR